MVAEVSEAVPVDLPAAPAGIRGEEQQRIARNAGAYIMAQLLSWAMTLASISVIPRALGSQMLGQIVLATSTVSMVFGVGAYSMESHITREVGRDARNAEPLLRNLYGMRFAMLPVLAIGSVVAVRFIHASKPVELFSLLALFSAALGLFAEPLRSTLVGWEDAKRVSVTDLLFAAGPLAMIPFLRYKAYAYFTFVTLAIAVVFLIRLRWVRSRSRLRPAFDLKVWRELYRGGTPFFLTNLISSLYAYSGILVLHHFSTESAVGQFSQAGRLVGACLFIPTALNAALLPALTRLAQTDQETQRATQLRVLCVIIVLGLPVSAMVAVLSAPICHFLYGMHKFTDLPLALRYCALTILPLSIVSTVYQFLVAQNRNGIWTFFMAGTLVIYTVSAVILVPLTGRLLHNSVVGAVTATLIAEGASAAAALILLRTNPLHPLVLGCTVRSLIATAGMCLVMASLADVVRCGVGPEFLRRGVEVGVPAATGAAAFAVLAWLLRALPENERVMLEEAVRRKFGWPALPAAESGS